MVLVIWVFVIVLFYCLYHLDSKLCDYWEKRGVQHVPASSWFSLDIFDSLLLTPKLISKIYHRAEGLDYVGLYQMRTPFLMIRSPWLINQILNKEFHNFPLTRKSECSQNSDPLSQHLLALGGDQWKYVRSKLTPAFTSGKLKGMYGLIDNLVDEFLEILSVEADAGRAVDAEKFCSRLSVAVMLTTSFGIDTNCANPENDKFIEIGKVALEAGLGKLAKDRLRMTFPTLFSVLGLKAYDKSHSKLCMDFISEVIQHRKTTGMRRPDFVDILMRLRAEENAESADKSSTGEAPGALSDGMITAQVYSFLVAGYETTTTTLSCTLFELAQDPMILKKLRMEVQSTLEQFGSLNYENVHAMVFLDRVIKEALRKHPPVVFMMRICTKTTYLPGTSILLEPGTNLIIPVLALHRDAKHYPCPEEFLPQRFAENFQDVPYLPFSEGPRKCIGMRFALLEVKMVIARIVLGFDIELHPETSKTIKLERFARTYKMKSEINLIFKKTDASENVVKSEL